MPNGTWPFKFAVTTIIVAHHLSTIRHADRIYAMEAGRVVQQGSFEKLAAEEGLFARLMARQVVKIVRVWKMIHYFLAARLLNRDGMWFNSSVSAATELHGGVAAPEISSLLPVFLSVETGRWRGRIKLQ